MHISVRSAVTAAAAAGLLFVLSACGGVTGTPSVGNAAATGTTASTTTSQSPTTSGRTSSDASATSEDDPTLASGVTIEELRTDVESAVTIVDEYWAGHWGEYFTGTYTAPTVADVLDVRGVYDGSDPDLTPTCDGEPLEEFNAFYCVPEDYVAWDAGLLLAGADEVGDAWVYLIVAHEWGHAVQARLDSTYIAEAKELQADCLAGAALYGAAADGRLDLEAGDEQEIVNSLSLVSDQMPWTMVADHGDPFQRVQWFNLGRNAGVNACFDVIADPSASTAPSSLDVPPPTTG
jgi:predicted metalloprotease